MFKRGKKKQAVRFNEYDEDPRRAKLKQVKKKKRMRRLRLIALILAIGLCAAYYVSDYSQVQYISVKGNEVVDTDDIKDALGITTKDKFLFVSTRKAQENVEALGMIKKAKVSRTIYGGIKVTVEEDSPVAYAVFKKKTYVVDSDGDVIAITNKDMIATLRHYPKISRFKSLKMIKKLARQYVKLPDIIKNAVSDILYDGSDADPNRVRLLMDNGKEIDVRIDSMADDLATSHFDYEAYVTEYDDYCVFSFEGNNLYMKKCSDSGSDD